MRAKYICNKCNHGDCELIVEGEDGDDTPTICPYNTKQMVNWKLGE